jgi:glycosyltransferase involved in cell wall biosynthesis
MKVVHVNEHLARKGGVETYMLSLLPMLDARQVKSTVAYGAGNASDYAPSVHVPGIGYTGLGNQGEARRQMQEVLDLHRPDVIHVHNIQSLGVLQACLDYGSTIMTAHDFRAICPASMLYYKRTQEICPKVCGPACFTTTVAKHCLTPRPKYAAYYYRRSRWIMGHTSSFAHVIAPSGGARERLVQAGFERQDVTVLPYFCPIQPSEFPRPLPDRPTITFIGRLAPNKGVNYFVQALGQLPEEVQGILVGNLSDNDVASFQETARSQGCGDRVALHRWATPDEVRKLLDQTTIFIFPSLWPETLGIVGLEALARGVPVVASDVGGVREWLRDRGNGILVPPKSAACIRDAVLELLSSEQKLKDYGENGIRTIREKFLPEQHVDALLELYQRAAA